MMDEWGCFMNKKDNQRARLTRMLLKQAYMKLLKEKKANKVTVRDICERAEVNRSTFYLHYAEPNDLLIEIEDEAIALVKEALSLIGAIHRPSPSVSEYLLTFVQYIRKNEELFRTLLIENNDPHFRWKLQDVALEMTESNFQVALDHDYKRIIYQFIISGSLEVLTEWIKRDFALSEHSICEILYRLSEGALRSVTAAQAP